jgi:hypothetical protein
LTYRKSKYIVRMFGTIVSIFADPLQCLLGRVILLHIQLSYYSCIILFDKCCLEITETSWSSSIAVSCHHKTCMQFLFLPTIDFKCFSSSMCVYLQTHGTWKTLEINGRQKKKLHTSFVMAWNGNGRASRSFCYFQATFIK